MKTAILISTLIVLNIPVFSIARADPVVTEGRAAVSDTAKVTKKRVKKTPTQTKQKGSTGAEYSSEPEEETSFWGACLGSLCGSFMASVCNSSDSGESTHEVESGISATDDDYRYESDDAPTYYQGNIEPADSTKNSVKLWNNPGGYEADGFVLGNLQRGTEVTVIRFDYHKITLWALVKSNEYGSVEGWVMERDVVSLPEQGTDSRTNEEQPGYQTPFESSTSTTSSPYARGYPKFVFFAELSYPVFTNKSIREEYQNADSTKFAYRFGAEAGIFVSKTMNISFSFGYLHAEGEPLYDYEANGLRDSPQDSDLQVWNYGLQFGQLFLFRKDWFFSYGIAPAVFKVKESALITEYENGIYMGYRTDELSEWKVGGEVNAKIGGTVAKKVPISLSVRYSLIPWESNEEQSLTLDYLDSNSISIFSFGFSIGYLLF